MIIITCPHAHENRTPWFVSTCLPCLLVVWVLAWFTSTPLRTGMVDCRRSPAPYSYTTSTRMSVSSRSANESACPSVLRGGGVAANS